MPGNGKKLKTQKETSRGDPVLCSNTYISKARQFKSQKVSNWVVGQTWDVASALGDLEKAVVETEQRLAGVATKVDSVLNSAPPQQSETSSSSEYITLRNPHKTSTILLDTI